MTATVLHRTQPDDRRERMTRIDGTCDLLAPGVTLHALVGGGCGAIDLATGIATLAPAAGLPAHTHPCTEAMAHDCEVPPPGAPERLTRFDAAARYDLAEGADFRDLFRGFPGCTGICGGYALFQPGKGLPCHIHDYDESISIVVGEAVCQVAGAEYTLTGCGTALVPRGRPHRFINRSDRPMAMIWVYAGDTPDRVIVEEFLCERGCGPVCATGPVTPA